MSGFSQHHAQQRLTLGQHCSAPAQAAQTHCLGLRRSVRTLVLQRVPYRTRPKASKAQTAGAGADSSSESDSVLDGSSVDAGDSDTQSWDGGDDPLAGPARRSRTARQQVRGTTAPPAACAAAADAGPAEQAAPASGQHLPNTLHQPYSRFLVCGAKFMIKKLCIASQLVTDLAELHSEGSCAVQVSVVVHHAGWGDSQECRDYIEQQQQPNAAQQRLPASTQQYGPYEARLKCEGQQFVIRALCHGDELQPFVADNAHTLVLREKVPVAAGQHAPPHFRLHAQPGSPAQPRNHYSRTISRAGEGKGLQVFPGSVTEVTTLEAGELHIEAAGGHMRMRVNVPRPLVCSQLPATVKFPLSITVTVLEQWAAGVPDRPVGQWPNPQEMKDMKLYQKPSNGQVYWRVNQPNPLSAYDGRRIAKMSLMPHQDSFRLTLTLAAPATPAPVPTPAAAGAGTTDLAPSPQPVAAAHPNTVTTTTGTAALGRAAAAPGPHIAPAQPAAPSAATAAPSMGPMPPPAAALLESLPASLGLPADVRAGTAAGCEPAARTGQKWRSSRLAKRQQDTHVTPAAARSAPPASSTAAAAAAAAAAAVTSGSQGQVSHQTAQRRGSAASSAADTPAAAAAAAEGVTAQQQPTGAYRLAGSRDPRSVLLHYQQLATMRRDAGSGAAATAGPAAASAAPSNNRLGITIKQLQQQQTNLTSPPAAAAAAAAEVSAAPTVAVNSSGPSAAAAASAGVVMSEPAAFETPSAPLGPRPMLLPLKRPAEQPLVAAVASAAAAAKVQRKHVAAGVVEINPQTSAGAYGVPAVAGGVQQQQPQVQPQVQPAAPSLTPQPGASAQLLLPPAVHMPAAANAAGTPSPSIPAVLSPAAAAAAAGLAVKQEPAGAHTAAGPLWPQPLLLPLKRPAEQLLAAAGQQQQRRLAAGAVAAHTTLLEGPTPEVLKPAGSSRDQHRQGWSHQQVMQQQQQAAADRANLFGAAAMAAAGPLLAAAATGPVSIKQELPEVIDLAGDTDDDEGCEAQGQQPVQRLQQERLQQQQQTAPLPVPQLLPGAPAAAAAAAGAAAAAAGDAARPAAASTAPQPAAPATPSASPFAAQPGAAAHGSVAAAAASAPAGTLLLPPGLQLLPASSAAAMEEQLTALLCDEVRPRLAPQQLQQYSRAMEQLGVVFGRHMCGQGVSAGQLKTMYAYVQAAVDGGVVEKVLDTLEDRLGRLLG